MQGAEKGSAIGNGTKDGKVTRKQKEKAKGKAMEEGKGKGKGNGTGKGVLNKPQG